MNETTVESSDRANSLGIGIWVVLGAIVLSFIAYWAWIAPLVTDNKFDPLNALFSGLAFWGVIYAILLQKSELALQRKELELTRGEVRSQKEQLEAQNLTLKQQRFENTFFSLLNVFIGLIDSMEVTDARGASFRSKDCFTLLYHNFQTEYAKIQHDSQSADSQALCIAAYNQFANYRQMIVGHYFQTLYIIVKFIDESHVNNKQTYVNVVKAQLSSSELNLLFYYCLGNYGSIKFKPYVEQFGLLENMMPSDLIRQDHKSLYKESAFTNPL